MKVRANLWVLIRSAETGEQLFGQNLMKFHYLNQLFPNKEMGIPKFYSRMLAYGSNEVVGRRLYCQSQDQKSLGRSSIAIIDGPSLAHSVFDELITGEHANEKAKCFYRYEAICRNFITWLDNLCSFGFEMYVRRDP